MQVVLAPLSYESLAALQQMPPPSDFSSRGKELPGSEAQAANESALKTGKPRALIVDDAPDVTEMIALFLQHMGYEVVMAFSAPEALEAARRDHFEVIVSDIGMPGMNGYDLAVALRALPEYSDIPMIAVTGFSMYDDRSRALQSGFSAHMTKPINPMALLDLIKSLRD